MSTVAEALAEIPANNLVVDGEVIVPDEEGRGNFSALEAAWAKVSSHTRCCSTSLTDGFDLRAAPLVDRKRALAGLVAGIKPHRSAVPSPIVYSAHMEVDGSVMFEHACKLHLEGVVSQLREAPYEEFAIVGFESEGKHRIAALHLARKG